MTALLAVVLVAASVTVFWLRSRSAIRASIWLLALVAVATLFSQGIRPATAPLFIWALFVVTCGASVRRHVEAWRRLVHIPVRVVLSVITVLCVLLTAITWVSPPPAVTGPHAVGVFDWIVKDPSRAELYTQDPDDVRELVVRVWYPSEASPADETLRAQWMESIEAFRHGYIATEVADDFVTNMLPAPVGSLLGAELRRLKSPGAQGIPISPGTERFPVLLFSPGYSMSIDLSAAHLAEIASHGYVVLGINATYETNVTAFPDGRVLRRSEMLRQNETGRAYESERLVGAKAQELFPEMLKLMDLSEPQRRARYLELRQERMEGEQFLVSAIDERVGDFQLVLTQLEALANGTTRNLLSDRIDLERVGAFGMSLGGPSAGQFCLIDARCKAGLNYDGEIWGQQLASLDSRVPFMWIRGGIESQQGAAYSLGIRYVFESSAAPVYHVEIADMDHMHFTDLAFLSPFLNWLALPLDKKIREPDYVVVARQIALDYTVAFFDRYLKDTEQPLLSGVSLRPEVKFERRHVEGPALHD